jgi:hypothetical protein
MIVPAIVDNGIYENLYHCDIVSEPRNKDTDNRMSVWINGMRDEKKIIDLNEEFQLKTGDIIAIRSGYDGDIAYTVKIIGFSSDIDRFAYLDWDCYWFGIDLHKRLLKINPKELMMKGNN